MDSLLRKRIIYQTELNKAVAEWCPDVTDGSPVRTARTIEEVQIHLEELDRKRAVFLKVQEAYEAKVKTEDLQLTLTEHGEFETNFIRVKTTLRQLVNQLTVPISPHPVASVERALGDAPNVTVQLPKITLPTFSGNYTDWPSFADLFQSLVHDKPHLTGVQKMQYLKGSLRDEPLRLIQVFQVTEANYAEAWSRLKERYFNPRIIVLAHIRAIVQAPSLSCESAAGLRRLIDTVQQNLSALTVLHQPTTEWSSLLLYLLCEKLDPETKKQWELSLKGTELPSFAELLLFLETRSRALEAATPIIKPKPSQLSFSQDNSKKVTTSKHHTQANRAFVTSELSCAVCEGAHTIYLCNKFMGASPKERSTIAKAKRLCYNCLGNKHAADACKSSHSCKTCKKRHHTLLHFETTPTTAQALFAKDSDFQVMLSTVVIDVRDNNGHNHQCRALLDSGSQANFVTTEFANRLNLPRRPYAAQIHGLSSSTKAKPQGVVNLEFHSRHSNFKMSADAIILPHITNPVPSSPVDSSSWTHVAGLPLADPDFNKPLAINALLGAEVFAHVLSGQRLQGDCGPAAFKTEFGWVLTGQCKTTPIIPKSILACMAVTQDLNQHLKRFWEIEEPPQKALLTKEESDCEEHFRLTHTRNQRGQYVTELPFKPNSTISGDSRRRALNQLVAMEARLVTQPEMRHEYIKFMQEYERLHHMEPIVDDPSSLSYYIPHHPVLKPDSTSTKLRVVFNASAQTSSGTSLNDCLMVGPQLQPTLIEQIIRFRCHKVALVADIEKMYRQVQVATHHQNFQRIVWREKPSDPIRDFRLTTVTYGTASAPFAAVRALTQLAEDESHRFPIAARALVRDFYVDDLLSGAPSESEALTLKSELTKLLKLGGFNLRKWASNMIATNFIQQPHEFDQPESTKTLGIGWIPNLDVFFIACKPPSDVGSTKRALLAEIAKLFDPLGWLAPIILIGKLLIQRLWILKSGWDDEVPFDIRRTWKDLCDQWFIISEFRIPRYLHTSPTSQAELHGFSDACEGGYGAVVYLRVTLPSGEIKVSLLIAKTKVAPLKQLSIPRLELCGAVLLSRLISFITNTLDFKDLPTVAWTDSTIVLNWLSDTPRRWKTFVANRVAEIQESLPACNWRHISTHSNPADCCSRGLMPADLAENTLWWQGPPWLSEPVLPPFEPPQVCHEASCEAKPVVVLAASEEDNAIQALICKISSLHRLIRVVAYCLRFIKRCQSSSHSSSIGPITNEEFTTSKQRLIVSIQATAFSVDIKAISSGLPVTPTSRLKSLNPFLDQDGVLRVGGRLSNAAIPFNQQHPIILPHDHQFSKLVVEEAHLRLLHAGPTLLLASLRQQYWILKARSIIKMIIHRCITCFRMKGEVIKQLMGDLPAARVEPARAFIRCGVDCAGPFMIRDRIRAGRPQLVKSYVVLFVCFASKAIHLELASDLSSHCFLAAFKRFCARRGIPHDVFSDCGTNFVGAQAELKFSTREFQESIQAFAVPQAISWHFNPPAAPHMGGLWEAGIKSTKFHIQRVVGTTPLTYEELSTVLTQVEACLNSRPLCAMSSSPDDVEPLTPSHFLIGEALTAVPSRNYIAVPDNRLKTRWNLIQKLAQTFWSRWSSEYLSQLQNRPKWMSKSPNIAPGDLVLVKDECTNPLQWALARIVAIHPGRDSIVRVATINSRGKTFKRPITKLCKLPLD